MNNKNIPLQQGFSLIELMIAMVLGLFLVAGIGTVYVSSKNTYAARNQLSELNENARVAIRALREHIEHAGYASTTGVPVRNYILPTGFAPTAASCPSGVTNIVGTGGIGATADGASGGSDQIGLVYLADESLNTDCTSSSWVNRCLPNGVTDPQLASQQARLVYNSFRVITSNGIPSLACGGSLNQVAQPIAQGIDNIQFRYGVDTTPTQAGQKQQWEVDNYWSAAQVAANNAWDKIVMVQVALLVRSADPVFPTPQAETYRLLDAQIQRNDRFKRAVYTTTIHLRNIAR